MTDFNERYIAARRAFIARDFRRLNPMQRQAAMTTEGPLLLLAGAGSGKTTVLIQRVYNLLTYGRGSDSQEVPDWATEEDLRFLETLPEQPDEETRRRAVRLCAVDVRKTENVVIVKPYVIPQNAVQHIRHDDGCGRFGLLFDVANIHHHALCVKTANAAQ